MILLQKYYIILYFPNYLVVFLLWKQPPGPAGDYPFEGTLHQGQQESGRKVLILRVFILTKEVECQGI